MQYFIESMPVLQDPTLKCLYLSLKPAERVNIKLIYNHLTLLRPRLPLVLCKEVAFNEVFIFHWAF